MKKHDRKAELLKALGHEDEVKALQHAEIMRSALLAIHTWASIPGALDDERTRKIAREALEWGRT